MKITPLEIRQKSFEKAFRGLDKDEVHAYLQTLSQQWERLLDENKDLKMKLEHSNREVQKMREVESSLYKTLKTAEDTGNNIMEQATKEAELKLREAQFKADQLINESRTQCRQMLEDAYKQAERTIAEMQTEVKALEQEHQRMESYLDNLVRDLRNLANDALEKVEKTKNKPKAVTGSILSKASGIKINEPDMMKQLKDTDTMKTITESRNTNGATLYQEKPQSNNPQPGTAPGHNPVPEPSREDPAPDVDKPKPEIPNPKTPVPDVPAPEIERPKPEINPGTTPAPEIERPAPEITPDTIPNEPEIQPPMTEPGRSNPSGPSFEEKAEKKVKQPAGGGSFFDEIG